ncbi:ComEC/Rec2 family competence protein [Pedobacter sp. CFBP9032]|uniref:ComEC/Rec2 family competence protein n=1 Tax=Pedobacter sp. CFBP9032 TaxID=3096539 RepID=UPI002A6A6184|nr:MBL fold metallo-hydrolase [Pedobacter sp. CFBP9032]MDY0904305.1 MBL fold metallo-hydrolase [Pedobacter sp. CFBP9032]
MEVNAFEIDFLAVGANSKSGDAIAMRFGNYENNKWNSQHVIVIDGGDKQAGANLVKHVKEVYNTNRVDLAILTHPDGDHASGLTKVLEDLDINEMLMHCPWNHWKELHPYCEDGRITTTSFGERLRRAYGYADEIENLAKANKIPITAPHQGNKYTVGGETVLTILGPSKEYYMSLIQESDKTPRMLAESSPKTFSSQKVRKLETMDIATENLSAESGSTSCENNMSLILYLTIAGKKILLTGDAGCDALYKAIYYAKQNNIDLKTLNYLQIPHHGSRHNLSQGILNEIHAPTSIISCAAGGAPKHPSPVVINALKRRDIKPFLTQGNGFYWHHNVLIRAGWGPATPAAFTNYVLV